MSFTAKGFGCDGVRLREGQGRTHIGDAVFEWGARDIFVAPGWMRCRHVATAESVLFSYSDRVVQEKLGVWREQSD